MSVGTWLRALRGKRDGIRLQILIKGRVGEGWYDLDRTLRVPEGSTLANLLDAADAEDIPLREAIENSPHLRETLMINGERCPLADNLGRVLMDGDEIYLLGPIVGG